MREVVSYIYRVDSVKFRKITDPDDQRKMLLTTCTDRYMKCRISLTWGKSFWGLNHSDCTNVFYNRGSFFVILGSWSRSDIKRLHPGTSLDKGRRSKSSRGVSITGTLRFERKGIIQSLLFYKLLFLFCSPKKETKKGASNKNFSHGILLFKLHFTGKVHAVAGPLRAPKNRLF